MYQIYLCLTTEHDLMLVAAAGLLCLFTCFTALGLLRRAAAAVDQWRLAWIAIAATMTGGGAWATHFIAILAFDPGLPMSVDPWLTLASALVAIVVAAIAYLVGFAIGFDRLGSAAAGVLLGGGIAALHYTGMSAVRLPGTIAWDPWLVALSVLLFAALGASALRVALEESRRQHVLGALCLTSAILALHFTGMGAARILPDPSMPVPDFALPKFWLALAIGVTSALLLAIACGAAILDHFLRLRGLANDARLRQLANAASEGIVTHEQGRIVNANQAFGELVGQGAAALVGNSLERLFSGASWEEIGPYLLAGDLEPRESELITVDGQRIPIEVSARPLAEDEDAARVIVVRDLREIRNAEARIRRLALHDTLTGLPNRRLLSDRLSRAIEEAARSGEQVAVLCLDLDRFKSVNDLLGHKAGDDLLREVASRIAARLRACDTVARLGGDEFAIVLPRLGRPEGGTRVAADLIEALAVPYELDGHEMVVGASIGVAFFPDDGVDQDALLRNSDLALYRAKGDGRGTFRVFQPEMDMLVKQRRALERDLRQALATGQLAVHYQPIIDCRTGVTAGYEALARWSHPQRGLVPPSEFIKVAEESGLILPLGEMVLKAACGEAALWDNDRYISVNLSPAQFRHGDLAAMVRAALAETGLPARRLKLEITETVLIDDTQRGVAVLEALQKLGVRIAIDDFGTGYSSLSYLQRFAFDEVKIDRSFVRDLETSDEARAIVRTIIALGRSLCIKVTAEGVETSEQYDLLRSEQCDLVQGYLFGVPAAASLELQPTPCVLQPARAAPLELDLAS
jgi:diguanylate cyclase